MEFYRTVGIDSKIENDLQGRQRHGVVGQMDLTTDNMLSFDLTVINQKRMRSLSLTHDAI